MFDAGAIVGKIKLDKSNFDGVALEVQNSVASLGQTVSKAGDQIFTVSKQISNVGKNLAFFGAGIITPMIVAFKSAEKYSNSVRYEMERLNNVTIQMRTSVAESLVPVMHSLSNVLADLLQRWNRISPAMRESILQTTFMAGMWLTLGGITISLASKVGQLVGRLLQFSGALLTFAAANPGIALTVAALAGVAFAIIKLGGLTPILNWLETQALRIAAGWVMVARSLAIAHEWSTRAADPLGLWSKQLLENIRQAQTGLTAQLEIINGKIKNLTSGNSGAMAGFVEGLSGQVNTIKDLFANLGKTEFSIPDTIFEATKSFSEGWRDAMKQTTYDLQNWGKMAEMIVQQTASAMQSTFSNFFQDAFKGQLKDAKEYFAEFGNYCLKIISDVIAQIITAKIVTGIGNAFSSWGGGASAASSTGQIGSGFSAGTSGLSFAEGTDAIPYTGMYRLHEGEKVTPKYDAGNNGDIQITIINNVSPETIAQGMVSKSGANVILNTIDVSAERNGSSRRTIRRK